MDKSDLIEAYVEAMQRLQQGQQQDTENKAKLETEKAQIESIKKSMEEIKKFTKTVEKESTIRSNLSKVMKGQSLEYEDVSKQLKELEEQLIKAEQAGEDLTAQEIRKTRATLQATANLSNLNTAIVKTVGVLASAAATGAKAVVNNLQSGTSDIQLAADIMTAGADAAGGAAQAAGGAISSLGSVGAASANKKLRVLGGAAVFAGEAIGFFGQQAGKLAKFGIEVLTKEVERTVKAFNDTTNAGALFADGAGGMRRAALDAGLTTDQFAAVVKNNSIQLAQSGLGVTEGARQIGRAIKIGGDTARNQLLKLGFGFEEQAELYAQITADMRRGIGGRVADTEIATQTQKYAENLRIIAAITGEDAKKKVDQARQENEILAFQQKMARLDKNQRAEINAAMGNMTEMEKRNLRERVIYGGIVRSTEGAIYESQLDAAREKGEYIYRLLTSNQLTTEASVQANVMFGERLRRGGLAATDFAVAANTVGGELGGAAKGMLDAINQSNIYTEEAARAGKINVEGQKTTGDKFTETMTNLSNTMQQLRIDFQENLTGPMENFATVAKEITATLKRQIDELGLSKSGAAGTAGKESDGAVSTVVGAVGGAAGGTVGMSLGQKIAKKAAGAAAGAALGSIIPGAGTFIGGIIGGLAGEAAISAAYDWFKSGKSGAPSEPGPMSPEEASAVPVPGMALGGIIRGPKQVIAGENPRFPYEAFVPLPDNKTIPVTVKMTDGKSMGFDIAQESRTLANFIAPIARSLVDPLSLIKDTSKFVAGQATSMFNQTSATVSMPGVDRLPDDDNTKRMLQLAFTQANEPLINAMREQIVLMQEQSDRFEKLVTISNESKDINQQLLNHAY